MGSSSLTKDWTSTPCVGRKESQPLDRRGSPLCLHVLSPFSHVQLFVTLWTVARQAALSVGFSRQEWILEWVAMPFSRGSFRPRDRTHVSCGSCTAGGFFTTEPSGKPSMYIFYIYFLNQWCVLQFSAQYTPVFHLIRHLGVGPVLCNGYTYSFGGYLAISNLLFGESNGTPLQYKSTEKSQDFPGKSLENPMDGGA